MTVPLRVRLIPLFIAVFVLLWPTIGQVWTHYQVQQTVQAVAAKPRVSTVKATRIEGVPNRIVIPSLNIDLPVVAHSFDAAKQTWAVETNAANYAANTAKVNNQDGQTLIYGHDTDKVFAPTGKLQTGDKVYVYATNGHIFTYSFVEAKDVLPTDAPSLFADMQHGTGIKLMTCDGTYYQYRRIMSFDLIKVS